MTLVVDASVVVAALVDTGAVGTWAEQILASGPIVAPHLLHVEVASALRRATAARVISDDIATLALEDLLDLSIALRPFADQADRIWALRATVTPYDASYVALAEALDAPLATLDRRLVRAPGPTCAFVRP